jgi:NhaA family Na+:H+ antiporter
MVRTGGATAAMNSPEPVQSDQESPLLARFLRSEVVGGLTLTLAGAAALIWANSPVQASYTQVWEHSARLTSGDFSGLTTVQGWVNGGIMTIFFLVVGLEIARERRTGALADRQTAIVPVVGALGGMAGAALVYFAVNHHPPGSRGWGIPMATDIAFALGALALLGRKVPSGLRLFLLTLAVADDIGSVVALAVFYSSKFDVRALAGAVVVVVALVLLRRRWTGSAWPYLAGGVVLWALMAAAGVEPALAGVVVGVLIPSAASSARPGTSAPPPDPAGRIESALTPVSAFVVLPLFALANAGVTIESTLLSHPGATGVFVGIVLARLVGKMAGIALACLIVVRLGVGRLPPGVTWGHMAGGAAVAGIGFTVPLLFAEQAFASHPPLVAASQAGLLAGSIAAFVVGATVLLLVARRQSRRLSGGSYAGHPEPLRPTGLVQTRATNEETS